MMNSTSFLGNIPAVVKNLVIINIVVFVLDYLVSSMGIPFVQYLGLFPIGSQFFMPHQFVTHMFMHGDITHIFFNMFALWMFGRVLETLWGGKRFLIYYIVTGLGAAMLHSLVVWLSLHSYSSAVADFMQTPTPDAFVAFVDNYMPEYHRNIIDFIDGWKTSPENVTYLNEAKLFIQTNYEIKLNIPTVGASGAVFGILLAFGMLFPNTQLMLLFPPIPIKAKYFVIGYGVLELYFGLMNQPGDNVAHFAHLGGMLFGFFLLKSWQKGRNIFRN